MSYVFGPAENEFPGEVVEALDKICCETSQWVVEEDGVLNIKHDFQHFFSARETGPETEDPVGEVCTKRLKNLPHPQARPCPVNQRQEDDGPKFIRGFGSVILRDCLDKSL